MMIPLYKTIKYSLVLYLVIRILDPISVLVSETLNLLLLSSPLYLAFFFSNNLKAEKNVTVQKKVNLFNYIFIFLILITSGIHIFDFKNFFNPNVNYSTDYVQRNIYIILLNCIILSNVVVKTVKSRKDLIFISKVFALCGLMLSLLGLFSYFDIISLKQSFEIEKRLFTFQSITYTGNLLIMTIFFTYFVFICSTKKMKFFWLFSSLLQIVALYFTFTRTAYIGFLICFCIFWLLIFIKDRSSFKIGSVIQFLMMGASIITILIAFDFQSHMYENIRWKGGIGVETQHFQTRYERWINIENMIKSNLVLGHGIGAGPSLISKFQHRSSTHSLYIKLIAETGLIGLILYFVLIGIILSNSLKLLKRAFIAKDDFVYFFCSLIFALTIGLSVVRIAESYVDFDIFQVLFFAILLKIYYFMPINEN